MITARAIHVRPAVPGDASALAAVHVDSITMLGARGYPPDQVALWVRPCVPGRYLDAMAGGEQFFVAVTTDEPSKPLGFSAYRVEHGLHRIATYVAGFAARCGIGTALFRAAEAAARAAGATAIHVDSSLVAVEFYGALGFVERGRGAHPLRVGGEMQCVFMEKALSAAPTAR